jgi:hypothetical protein
MADEEKVKVREGLKRDLSAAFNKVASKVVKMDDLIVNFDNLAGNNLGLIERGIASSKMRELASNLPAAPGVYVGEGSSFVSTDFLKKGMIQAVDLGKLDGWEDAAKRAAVTTVQAVEKSPDQTAKVQTGQIKPKAP